MADRKPILKGNLVARRVARRSRFEEITSNGTIAATVMVFAALAAVIVANTKAYETFIELSETWLGFSIGEVSFGMTLEEFVNDFLMSIFFLLVGIELKYEMTVGQLRRPRQAILPMLAAVGGATVPCIIYLVFNADGAASGWAIPMATDIAFALGIMSLLGDRVAPETKVFFQTLAIADDILGIFAIAIFYGQTPNIPWCCGIIACCIVLGIMNRLHLMTVRPYLVVGFVLWLCFYESGIHATLAGVVFAFFLPGRTDVRLSHLGDWLSDQAELLDDRYDADRHILGQHDFSNRAHGVERIMHYVTPPLERVERNIAVLVNFLILPIFAFMNAQVRVIDVDMSALIHSSVCLGAYVGAVVGKPLGIIGVTVLLVKIGFAKLPKNVDWIQIIAVGLMGGMGFTMSILIANLAFDYHELVLAAKVAILAASITSGAIGYAFVMFMTHKPREYDDEDAEEDEALDAQLSAA